MKFHRFLFLLFAFILLVPNIFPHPGENGFSPLLFKLDREPEVRIGLLTNSSYVSINTSDPSLVAEIGDEPGRFLGTTALRISSRSYDPPVYEIYRFEIPNIETRENADDLAQRIRNETGESASVMTGATADTWRVRLGTEKHLPEDAKEFQDSLTGKGFVGVEIVAEKYTLPSDDAIELTRQIAQNPKSEVRSLIASGPSAKDSVPGRIQTIASSRPVRSNSNVNAYVNPSLREVLVSGSTETSKFSSLQPVVIGSSNGRGIVRLNGKAYRGKMEVFANSRGRLTVVNVVPLEDYLLGVVPSELSLPQIEAQKAQAVAARTYAVANINGYAQQGFDMVDTVWSQVYKGVSIETRMGTQAVQQTRGVVATYRGKPINALYTSTCGGRTENSGNIFEFDEPYLRGVDCSLEGDSHFIPFMIKSSRETPDVKNEANYELVRLAAKFSVNNYLLITQRFTDTYFEDPPTETELKSWLNQLAVKFGKPFPQFVTADTSKPLLLAKALSDLIYGDEVAQADTLMSESDIDYQLSFLDGGEIPKPLRPMMAMMMRDGWFSIYPDLTVKPQKHYSRAKILRLLEHIYDKKNWSLDLENGEARPTEDGKLILKAGRGEKEVFVSPNVFLFRKFGDAFYQVKETALLGGEKVNYKTNGLGQVIYLEVEPTDEPTVAEKMSPRTLWKSTQSAATVRANLSRYVKGMGALIDVKIAKQGFSRRAIDLEIITTNGTQHLKGGAIRSALKLYEQLFVINKRYASDGRVISYQFTGRGWGHGVGMCQYGAYGLAKMGVKFDQILKHYYTGIDLTKAY
ncbi:MAG: SpoIID/LytB domain-containing protein [Pyrinomonadaceae bacterium]